MIKYFINILRFSIISCLGFGGGLALLRYIFFTVNNHNTLDVFFESFKVGLSLGFIFTVFLILIFFLLDVSSRLIIVRDVKEPLKNQQIIWDIEQKRSVNIKGNINEVILICRQALMEISSISNVHQDSDKLNITAKTGITWRSFGEIITLNFIQEEENVWQVICTSSCKNKNVIFDYAKNFENVEVWLHEVNQLINTPT